MKKAALYARVSTPGQGEENKASIPEQIARTEKYCQEKQYTIADRYVDIGYSGAKKNRPEFQRMLNDARSSKFDVIVCWKADRLSRGMYPAAALMEVIEPIGISLEAVEEHLDMNYFAMLAVVGKMEIDSIKARTQMGREARIKKGKAHGKPPYGYSYNQDTGCFEIDEDEAKVVCQIFDLYAQGIPIRKIAAWLNFSGIRTKENSRFGWTVTKITEMVSQTFYYGEAYYNKRRGVTNKRKEKSMWLAMPIPPIVSRETFELAQCRKQGNKRLSPRKTKAVYLLQHLLFCQECGMHLYAFNRGNGRRGYVCRGMQQYSHLYSCRTPRHIPALEIDQLVWDKVSETLRSPAMLRLAMENRLHSLQADIGDQEKRLKEARNKLENLKLEESRVIAWARKGKITEEQMDLQLSAIREEKDMAEEDIRRVKEYQMLQSKQTDILEQAQKVCIDLQGSLDYLATAGSKEAASQKQAIIRLLVNRVVVNRQGQVTIELAIPEPSEVEFDYATLGGGTTPQGSFDYPTSPHAGLLGHRLGRGGVG